MSDQPGLVFHVETAIIDVDRAILADLLQRLVRMDEGETQRIGDMLLADRELDGGVADKP